jgi:pSer/pThr/pTyr-binding forkhead associated (FHA) protein
VTRQQHPDRFDGQRRVILRVTDTYRNVHLIEVDVDPSAEVVLGRRDTGLGLSPQVNLAPYGGYRKGVSRQHAAIRLGEHGHLTLCDLGSSNGTFLNGRRLSAQYPRRLEVGDEIRLGNLKLRLAAAPAVAQAAAGR